MTIRVIGNIILVQFSVWVHENSSDSLWHKNLNSEDQWCIKVMQIYIFKKSNTHTCACETERTEVWWRDSSSSWRFKVSLESFDFILFFVFLFLRFIANIVCPFYFFITHVTLPSLTGLQHPLLEIWINTDLRRSWHKYWLNLMLIYVFLLLSRYEHLR